MKKSLFIVLALLLTLLVAAPAGAARGPATAENSVANNGPARGPRGKVVVANRGSGSISVIPATATWTLPASKTR